METRKIKNPRTTINSLIARKENNNWSFTCQFPTNDIPVFEVNSKRYRCISVTSGSGDWGTTVEGDEKVAKFSNFWCVIPSDYDIGPFLYTRSNTIGFCSGSLLTFSQ